jgi:signal transduction histidine kinase
MGKEKHYGWPPVIPVTERPEECLSQFVQELKHPITAIKGYATLILEDNVHVQEAAEEIYRIATNMETVQNAVFDYLQARDRLGQM